MFIIFTFYYLPFLSSAMDCSCKVPLSIILILTMIVCDSFYNSILTKDWGDVWRGGNGGVEMGGLKVPPVSETKW